MQTPCARATLTLWIAAVIAGAGGPAFAADINVNLPAPTGGATEENNYNCTEITGAGPGQPLAGGDTITVSSTSEMTNVTASSPGISGGGAGSFVNAPGVSGISHTDSGNSYFQFNVSNPTGTTVLVVTYKGGAKRCFIISGTHQFSWATGGTLIVGWAGHEVYLFNWIVKPVQVQPIQQQKPKEQDDH